MNIDDYLKSDSDWLKKEDVNYKGVNLVISAVTEEVVGQEKEKKLALHFRGDVKAMLLNKVNLRILAAMFGTDTRQWMGEAVNVFNDLTVTFNGAQGGLRIRPPMQQRDPLAEQAAAYARDAHADAKTALQDDETIPF